jgi:hypothetical protein
MSEQFAAVEPLLAEHATIEQALGDPAVHADPARARALGRRYAALNRVVAAYPGLAQRSRTTPGPQPTWPTTRGSPRSCQRSGKPPTGPRRCCARSCCRGTPTTPGT